MGIGPVSAIRPIAAVKPVAVEAELAGVFAIELTGREGQDQYSPGQSEGFDHLEDETAEIRTALCESSEAEDSSTVDSPDSSKTRVNLFA